MSCAERPSVEGSPPWMGWQNYVERVLDHRNQITSAIKNHHISKKKKHPKWEFKDFTIIDRQQHPTLSSKRSTSHLYQRSITQQKHWQSQNPSVFNKLHTQLEHPHSSIPHPRGIESKDWIFRSPLSKKYIGKQFSHITKCHLAQKVIRLQVIWSSHQFIKHGWGRN